MALAHVNIADVSKFKESISDAKGVFFDTQDKFYNTLDIAIEKVNEGIREAKELIERCQRSIQALERKIESLQEVLAGLQASLAATPPTITETTQDEEGNIKTEEYPNPKYLELQSEISSCEAEISAIRSKQEQFKFLQQSINAAKERLDQAIQSFQTSLDAVADQYKRLNSVSEEAVNKLTKIEEILHKYLEEKLTPPKVSIPLFRGAGEVGGVLKDPGVPVAFGYTQTTTELKGNLNFIGTIKRKAPRKLKETKQTWNSDEYIRKFDSPEELGKNLNSKQGRTPEEGGEGIEGFGGTCGIVSVENILRMAGVDVTEAELIKYATTHSYVRDSKKRYLCTKDGSYGDNGGTYPEERQMILRHYGLESDIIKKAEIQDIASFVEAGKGVIASVDANRLWYERQATNAELHAVTVTSVQRDVTTNEILGFYICDSGKGLASWYIPVDKMKFALESGSGNLNVTKDIIR